MYTILTLIGSTLALNLKLMRLHVPALTWACASLILASISTSAQTIDANGRIHAPSGGAYGSNGKLYAGGQYMPGNTRASNYSTGWTGAGMAPIARQIDPMMSVNAQIMGINNQLANDYQQSIEVRQRKAIAKAAKEERLRQERKAGTDYRTRNHLHPLNQPFEEESLTLVSVIWLRRSD